MLKRDRKKKEEVKAFDLDQHIISQEEALDHIVQRAHNIVFHIGAGFSESAGIPLAKEIEDEMVQILYLKNFPLKRDVFKLEEAYDWLVRQQWYKREISFSCLTEKLFPDCLETFEIHSEGKNPTPAHYHLAMALKHNEIAPYVITTNFDKLMETAAGEIKGCLLKLVRRYDEYARWQDDGRKTLLKIHGDYTGQEFFNLRNYRKEYLRLPVEILEVVKQALIGRGLVVMGYGGNELSYVNTLIECNNLFKDFCSEGFLVSFKPPRKALSHMILDMMQRVSDAGKYARFFEVDDADEFMEKLAKRLSLPTIQQELSRRLVHFLTMPIPEPKGRKDFIRPALEDLVKRDYLAREFLIEDYEEIQKQYRPTLRDVFKSKEVKKDEAGEMEFKLLVNAFNDLKEQKWDIAVKKFDDILRRFGHSEVAWFGLGYALDEIGERERAVKAYDEALKFDPKGVGTMVRKAFSFIDSGDYNTAIHIFDQALGTAGKDAKILYNKGLALSRLGRYDEELEVYTTSLDGTVETGETLYNLGVLYGERHDYLKAAKAFQQGSKKAFRDPDAYYNGGVFLYQIDQFARALRNFEQALELSEENSTLYYCLGTTLCNLGRHEEALEYFQAYLEEKGEDLNVLVNYGVALNAVEKDEEARDMIERGIAKDPNNPIILYTKADLLSRLGSYDDALALLNRVLEKVSDIDEIWVRKAELLRMLDRTVEEIEAYNRALEYNNENVDAWFYRASAYGKLQNFEREIESYDNYLALNPKDEKAWFLKGQALSYLNRHEEALSLFKKYVEVQRKDPKVWYFMGVSFDFLKDYLKSVDAYDMALKLDPAMAEAHHNKGVVLGYMQQYEKALGCFAEAIKLKPDYLDAEMNRGLALGFMKRYSEALEAFNNVLAKDPRNDLALVYQAGFLVQQMKVNEAIQNLERAVGINADWKEKIRVDENFRNIAAHPRFQELVRQ